MRLVGALVSRERGRGRRMGKLDTFRDYLDFYFLFYLFLLLVSFYFLAMQRGLWDLGFPIRD